MKHYFCLFFVLLFAAEPLLATNSDDTILVSHQSGPVEGQDEPKQPQTWLEYCHKNRDYVMIGAGLLLMAAGCACLYYAKKVVPGIDMDSVTNLTNPLAREAVANPVLAKNEGFEYPKHYGPESRALVDELKEIHPIFGKMCDNKYEYPFECDMAVKALRNMEQAGKKDYGSLPQFARWGLEKEIKDPVTLLNAQQEIEKKIDALLDKKFAPQISAQEAVELQNVHGDETLKSDEIYSLWLALLGS